MYVLYTHIEPHISIHMYLACTLLYILYKPNCYDYIALYIQCCIHALCTQCVCCVCYLSGTASQRTPLGSHISPSPHSECTSHRSDKHWPHRAGSLRRSVGLCVNEQCICYTYPPILVRTYVHGMNPSWYMYSCRINCVQCSLPCSEHASPKYPGAQLHVLLATQTPVPLAHGGLQTATRVKYNN